MARRRTLHASGGAFVRSVSVALASLIFQRLEEPNGNGDIQKVEGPAPQAEAGKPAREESMIMGKSNHESRPREQRVTIPSRRTGTCEHCHRIYELQRSNSRFCSQTCRQRAHRIRLSVTATPSDSTELFRYVRYADVPRFTAEGWELLPALDGTHHGEYSVLMRRRVGKR